MTMELMDIMALVKAGYTKDEIAQMQKPVQSEPVSPVVPAQDAVPVPESVEKPVAVAEPVQEQKEQQITMQDLMNQMAKLTGAIQANAIAQSVMPNVTPVQAEDIMAEIIRPTFKGKE